MHRGRTIAAILPALDEERTIGDVVAAIDCGLVDRVIVADNGSTDGTAARARDAGADVVSAPRRGYGSACLAGIAAVRDADVLVFLDADGSDDPAAIGRLLDAMDDARADLVIGSRTIGTAASGALTPAQRFGNALACRLIRRFWGVRYTDLGPFRAVRREALERLRMSDPDMGWTVQMQVEAARKGLSAIEIPVPCGRRRAGSSKISGSLVGSWRAGRRILGTILRARLRDLAGTDG
jgi:glycosyltransferase involved in cell wall biosynthesis